MTVRVGLRTAKVALVLCVVAATAVFASPRPHALSSVPTIPAAWSGIWSYTDSTYATCTGGAVTVTTGLDTLCIDDTYSSDDTGGLTMTCDGTFDDNSATVTCTYSGPLVTDCTLTFTITSTATRTGDSYVETSRITQAFTPELCAFIGDSCKIVNRHATRIAQQPATCATPALPATWGQLKALYR